MRHPTFKYVFGAGHRPRQWGLRGDSELWDYLYATLYEIPVPRDAAVAERLVRDLIENRTGLGEEALASTDPWRIDMFTFQDRSGMSSGHVSPEWWRETGLGLIRTAIEAELSAAG